jgi:hypothetical protein
MEYMKLDKEWLLGSEFGQNICICVDFMDKALNRKSKYQRYSDEWYAEGRNAERNLVRWDMASKALQLFYGIHYNFTRTDKYYGICNDDESDWLYKVERNETKGENNA